MSFYEVMKTDTVNYYCLFSESGIANLKTRLSLKNLDAFKGDMEDLFAKPLESVTEKTKPVPDIDRHDYVSLATYFWPDKDNPGGPYVSRDGFVNPEGELYDKDKLKRLAYLSYHGALLYLITDEERYLDLVKKHLYNWFVDTEKRMNPHLEYGQFIPGVVKGRAEGIIDYGAGFTYALNMLHLLDKRGVLGTELKQGLAEWHSDFRRWLMESNIGKAECKAGNNHGTFYELILMAIEQFLGINDAALSHEESLKKRIAEQVAPDYSLPRETARTRSVSYSFMGLKGLLELAQMLERLGTESSSVFYPQLRKTVDWLVDKAIEHRESWPFPQVYPFDEGSLLLFQELATGIYGPEYERIQNYVDPNKIMNPVLYYLFYRENRGK